MVMVDRGGFGGGGVKGKSRENGFAGLQNRLGCEEATHTTRKGGEDRVQTTGVGEGLWGVSSGGVRIAVMFC